MKKLVCLLLTALLLTAACPFAFADTTVYVEEAELSLTFPEEYHVILRNTPADDPIFALLGVSASSLLQNLESGHIYADALTFPLSTEIVFTMVENPVESISSISDAMLDFLAKSMYTQFSEYNVEVLSHEIRTVNDGKYLVFSVHNTKMGSYGMQYTTIVNHRTCNFTIHNFAGEITSDQEETLLNVVKSIKFGAAAPAEETEAATEAETEAATEAPTVSNAPAFVYTDKEAKISFTVPAGWISNELDEDREFLDAKFVRADNSLKIIMCGFTDVWESMSPAERVGITRADVNDSLIDKAEIAETIGMTGSDIYDRTYNGTHYYFGEAPADKVLGSDSFTGMFTMTYLIHAENGWMYIFEYIGTEGDANYAEFEALLNTVKIGDVAAGEPEASSTGTEAPGSLIPDEDRDSSGKTDEGNRSPLLILLIVGAVVLIAVIAVVLLVTRGKKKKKAAAAAFSPAAGGYPVWQQPEPAGWQQPEPAGWQQPEPTGWQQPEPTDWQQPESTGWQQPEPVLQPAPQQESYAPQDAYAAPVATPDPVQPDPLITAAPEAHLRAAISNALSEDGTSALVLSPQAQGQLQMLQKLLLDGTITQEEYDRRRRDLIGM